MGDESDGTEFPLKKKKKKVAWLESGEQMAEGQE